MILLYFVLAIALIIIAGAKWKIHPFLVLIGVSLLLAIACGIPLEKLPSVVGTGFSSIFASIGLVIIFGTAIGLILEKSGGAVKLADMVLRATSRRHPQLAMLLLGWILSIPVFCDSGFVIMNPVRKSMARRSGISPVTLAVCLAGGLFISHVLVPPTPGPIAAAGMIGLEDNLLLVIGMGTLCSLFPLAACYLWALYIGPKIKLQNDGAAQEQAQLEEKDTAELLRESIAVEKLPGAWASALPLIVPIVLMGIGSILSITGAAASAANGSGTQASSLAGCTACTLCNLQSFLTELFIFLGKPVFALMAGFLFALPLVFRKEGDAAAGAENGNGEKASYKDSVKNKGRSRGRSRGRGMATLSKTVDSTLKTAGPIIFITAAGSILGQVIVESGFVGYIQESAAAVTGAGILFPFIIAALLKTSQGSSTVAITTTAGIMGMFSHSSSLMSIMGFTTPLTASLVVMAIGAGSMLFSHANDSYFWVVTNFTGMRVEQGYRSHSIMTIVAALATMLEVWLLYLLIC